MASPQYDYDPQSEEALQAAQLPVVTDESPMAQGFVPDYAVGDYGDASVPSQSDYAGEAERQMYGTAVDAQLYNAVMDEEQRAANEEQAQIEANLAAQGTPRGQAAMGANAAQGEADVYTNALLQTVTSPSAPNPVKPIAAEHAAYRTDLLGAQHAAKINTAEQTAQAGYNEAQLYEQEAIRQQAMIDAQQAKLLRDQARREQGIEAERHVMKAIQDASDKLAKTPDDDRGRYWSSRKWYQKSSWAISAIIDGMLGLDPMGAFNSAVEGDLADQRAAREARRGELGAQIDQLGATRSIYADLRSTIGDDEIAGDALRVARYEQAKTLIMAGQLRNGIPLQQALQHEGILELDQKINDVMEQQRTRLALMPDRVGGGTRPALRGPMRATVEKLRAENSGEARALREQGTAAGFKEEEQARGAAYKVQEEEAKGRAAADTERAKGDADARKKIVENNRDWGMLERMILDWEDRNTGDVPGTGVPLTGTKEQRIENDQFDTILPEIAIKAITGANAMPEQRDAAMRLVKGSWSEFTDTEKRARLRSLRNIASASRRMNAQILSGEQQTDDDPTVIAPSSFQSFQPE